MLAVLCATASQAQANFPTASKGVELNVFGMGSYVRPEYGGALRNGGGAVGVDADIRPFFGLFKPGLEIRVTGSGGRVSNQYTYGGGGRVIIGDWHVRPYANFLVNYGQIKFNANPDPTYQQDHAMVLSYGGGAEIPLSRSWAAKVDVQSERWRLTYRAPPFYPLAVSAGVRYQLHFRTSHSPD
jgi:hypothetical protein